MSDHNESRTTSASERPLRATYERPKLTKKKSVSRATLFSGSGGGGFGGGTSATGITSA